MEVFQGCKLGINPMHFKDLWFRCLIKVYHCVGEYPELVLDIILLNNLGILLPDDVELVKASFIERIFYMDSFTLKKVTGHSDALFQQFHQVLNVLDWHLWIVRRDCIVAKSFLHPFEDIDIVHN